MKIIVMKAWGTHFEAFLEGNPAGSLGSSEEEAVGKLVLSNASQLCMTVERRFETPEDVPDRVMHNMEKRM